ncbi:MAG: T9SS type A sorting domain-containing protein [Bacteroidota bacterium]
MKQIILLLMMLIPVADLSSQWVSQKTNLSPFTSGFAMDALNDSHIVAGIETGMIRSTDGGTTWNTIFPKSTYGNVVTLSITDSVHIWAGTMNGDIYSSTNGGVDWVQQFHDPSKTTYLNYLKMFNLTEGVAIGDALSGTLPAVILKTNDGGAHWISINDSSFGGFSSDTWRMIDFISPAVGFFKSTYGDGITPSYIWKTTDSGYTWTQLDFSKSIQVLRFYNDKIGIVSCYNYPSPGYSFHRTVDGGTTWEVVTPLSPGAYQNDFFFCQEDPSLVWMTDNQKLFFSADTGRTWKEQCAVKGRDIDFGSRLVGWVLGDGDILRTTEGGITSISMNNNSGRPATFSLLQNFPNPFNPSTIIEYELPEAGNVRITIFNPLGQLIMELFHGEQSAGRHSIPWKAFVTSGVYFYSMEAVSTSNPQNSFVQVKKMVLLR